MTEPDTANDPMAVLGLLWHTDHAMGTLSRQMLTHIGVTSPQRLALRVLVRQPEITASGLADVLHVDRSTVTGILRRLEAASLVERSPDAADGRKQRIVVTPAGRRLADTLSGTVESAMRHTLAGMPPDQIRAVTGFLSSFSTELERERHALVAQAPETR